MNFQLARANMVAQQVKPWYVVNEHVLLVLSQIVRETFVPQSYANLAYSDIDIPLTEGQTMLSPKVVGRALQALDLTGQEKVLEIGTGTGYVSACLCKLAAKVISIEIQSELLEQAQKCLATLNSRNLTLEQADGVMGFEESAPYDAIIVTGSYPLGVPQKVLEQLNPHHGRLFAVCGLAPSMQAILIERQGKSDFRSSVLFETVVPALIHAPQSPAFQF